MCVVDNNDSENVLNVSKNCYNAIFFNNHTVMLLIDPFNGDIVDANPMACDFYGYSKDELVNMKICQINTLEVDNVFDEMQKAVSERKNHFIFKHRLSNGEIRDVDVYSGIIKRQGEYLLYSIIHDISDQEKAENSKQISEELFKLIFYQSPIGSMISTLDFKSLRVNNALSHMLGYSNEELLSMKFQDYTYPEDLDGEVEQKKRLILGEIDDFIMEKRYIHKNGDIIWGNLFVSAVKDQTGKPVYILSLVEDINRRKYIENLVVKRTDKLTNINKILNVEIDDYEKAEIVLEELVEKLEISNKELEQFAYISSHDLKEPLRMITMFLQLLNKKYKNELDQDAIEYINFAIDGAKRLNVMINDLLEYSRIGSQARELNYENSEQILEIALINLKTLIGDNRAIITHDPLPTIFANNKQMIQLFQNIIGNAIKYRSEEIPKIHISAEKHNEEYTFAIKDNGIGIDTENLERIFTIFHRLHTREKYEGSGIGLAISHKIIQQHHGKIWATSEPEKGTTFYFTIPIKS